MYIHPLGISPSNPKENINIVIHTETDDRDWSTQSSKTTWPRKNIHIPVNDKTIFNMHYLANQMLNLIHNAIINNYFWNVHWCLFALSCRLIVWSIETKDTLVARKSRTDFRLPSSSSYHGNIHIWKIGCSFFATLKLGFLKNRST